MLATVLQVLFTGFLAFTACDYALGRLFGNTKAVVVSAAIFAVLVVLFAGKLVL